VLQIRFAPGLPDGIFSNLKYQCGQISEDLAMEDVGILYGHLVYFVTIWYILWPFGIFCGQFEYFMAIRIIFSVLVYCTKKNLATMLCSAKTRTKIVDFFLSLPTIKKNSARLYFSD
jgi:hypothetical protein